MLKNVLAELFFFFKRGRVIVESTIWILSRKDKISKSRQEKIKDDNL